LVTTKSPSKIAPHRTAGRVDCLLRELGWSEAFPERRQAAWFERGDRLFFHGEADRMLFLRKSVFPEAGAAPPGRASTAEVRLHRCRARIPQTTSMLYGTLLRCADWRPYPPLHAMAKVFFLAGKGEADWDTVAEWSAEDGTERILRSVCGFFEKETGRPLKGAPPAASMAVFRKTSALVFMGGRAFCLSPLPLWFRFLDECAVTGSAPALAAFLDFLSRRWRKRGKADTLAVFLWDCLLTPLRFLAARVGVTVPARRFRMAIFSGVQRSSASRNATRKPRASVTPLFLARAMPPWPKERHLTPGYRFLTQSTVPSSEPSSIMMISSTGLVWPRTLSRASPI